MKFDDRSMYGMAMKSIGYSAKKDPSTLESRPGDDEFQRFLDKMNELKRCGSAGAWQNRVLCIECKSENCSAPFESRFENSFKSVCGNCGAAGQFYDSIERWWSLSVWWKPITWGAGYWETKS